MIKHLFVYYAMRLLLVIRDRRTLARVAFRRLELVLLGGAVAIVLVWALLPDRTAVVPSVDNTPSLVATLKGIQLDTTAAIPTGTNGALLVRGANGWVAIPGTDPTQAHNWVAIQPGSKAQFLRGDGTWAATAPPAAIEGFLPSPSGNGSPTFLH